MGWSQVIVGGVVAVHVGGSSVSLAAQEAAAAFARHEADLAEAATGWVGESARALGEFITAVSERHAADHAAIAALGDKMTDVAARYANTDADRERAVAAVSEAMGL